MIKIYQNNDFYNSHKKFDYEEKGFKLARDGNIFEDICSSAKSILFVYEVDEEPVAFLKLFTNRKSSYFPTVYNTFSFIDVKENCKNQGISKILINKLLEYMKENNLIEIVITSYEEEGGKFLKNNLEKLLEENNIKFYNID